MSRFQIYRLSCFPTESRDRLLTGEVDGAVAIAACPGAARVLVAEHAKHERWLDMLRTDVEIIGEIAGPQRIIMESRT